MFDRVSFIEDLNLLERGSMGLLLLGCSCESGSPDGFSVVKVMSILSLDGKLGSPEI